MKLRVRVRWCAMLRCRLWRALENEGRAVRACERACALAETAHPRQQYLLLAGVTLEACAEEGTGRRADGIHARARGWRWRWWSVAVGVGGDGSGGGGGHFACTLLALGECSRTLDKRGRPSHHPKAIDQRLHAHIRTLRCVSSVFLPSRVACSSTRCVRHRIEQNRDRVWH